MALFRNLEVICSIQIGPTLVAGSGWRGLRGKHIAITKAEAKILMTVERSYVIACKTLGPK